MEVWFNPSCSECRSVREHLEDAGVEYTLRRYLDDPPSEPQLRAALTRLGLAPWDVTRMAEPLARELGLKDLAKGTPTRGSGSWRSTRSSSSAPSSSPTTAGRGWPGTTRRSPKWWRPDDVRPMDRITAPDCR